MAGEYLNYRLTTDAVLYFSNLHETSRYTPANGKPGDPRYNLKLLLQDGSDDLNAIIAMIKLASGVERGMPDKHPLTKGAVLLAAAEAKGKDIDKMAKTLTGMTQFSAHATAGRPPMLGCFINGVPTNLSTPELVAAAKDKFYTGALVRAEISVKAYSEFGGGVTGYFNSVFSTGRGDRIGGQSDATAFAGLKAHVAPAVNNDF
jgi:hypothetical protein